MSKNYHPSQQHLFPIFFHQGTWMDSKEVGRRPAMMQQPGACSGNTTEEWSGQYIGHCTNASFMKLGSDQTWRPRFWPFGFCEHTKITPATTQVLSSTQFYFLGSGSWPEGLWILIFVVRSHKRSPPPALIFKKSQASELLSFNVCHW